MTTTRQLAAPLDAVSAQRLRDRGLTYALLPDEDAAIDSWYAAMARGFHGDAPEPDEGKTLRRRAFFRGQRLTGVWASGREAPHEPVGTTASWIAPLTLPGATDPIDLWSISDVTVATTHAGRGIARALLEGELRTAASAGLAVAGLTVSESTLYGRYGFGIATQTDTLEIDTTRVAWTGPVPELELELVDAATARDDAERLHREAAARTPGDVQVWPARWGRDVGSDEPADAETRKRRFVRALADGKPIGLAWYRLEADPGDFTHHTLHVGRVIAPREEALAALWRHLLTQPLVRTVRADLVPPDSPVRWWCGDWRGVRQRITDHQWLRILDVERALAARGYSAPGRLGLRVSDPLGFADGDFALRVGEDGAGAGRSGDGLGDAPALSLDASTLASLWLGTFSASALAAAGKVRGDAKAIAAADRIFAVSRAPFLSTWY